MTNADSRAVVERYFSIANRRNFAELTALFGPKYVVHFDGTPPLNAETLAPVMGGFFTAFPDLRHTVEDMLVDGNRVAARITVTGTHQGELMGIPPSQRPVSFSATYIFHIADGCIAEQWINSDTLGMLQQIGAIPTPGA